MAKICGWCGEEISIFDLAHDWVKVDDAGHWLCGRCCENIAQAKRGVIKFSDIVTNQTDPSLFQFFAGCEEDCEEIRPRQNTDTSHVIDPLYEDIHQIADDLRFIKNYLIFSIVVGIICGIFWLFSLIA